jgi:putative membrane protein
MKIAGRIIISIALVQLSALAVAQAVDPQANGNKPFAPSSEVRTPATDGGLNEAAPANPPDAGATSTHAARTAAKNGQNSAAADQAFVRVATQSGLTEVELGKLALSKSSEPDVKTFAEHMVRDHTKANAELSAIATSDGLSVPTALDAKHAALVKNMQARSGNDFDHAFAKQMAADHFQAVSLFKNESSAGSDKLAAFAQKTLPTLEEHKRMAGQLGAT